MSQEDAAASVVTKRSEQASCITLKLLHTAAAGAT